MDIKDQERIKRFKKAYKEESSSMTDRDILSYLNELKAQKQEVDRHFEESCVGEYAY